MHLLSKLNYYNNLRDSTGIVPSATGAPTEPMHKSRIHVGRSVSRGYPDNVRDGSAQCRLDKRVVWPWLFFVLFIGLSALPLPAQADDAPDFRRDVRPLLSDRCLACHGPDEHERQADLRLDDLASMTENRDGNRVVVPGEPELSELMVRITSDDEFLTMPPPDSGKTLNEDEIDILRRWIVAGAEVATHWAYVPPERHPVPLPQRTNWSSNWIDDFLLHRLESEGLQPSPDADTVTLIRRLYFDLTGLPPSPADISEWTARIGTRSDAPPWDAVPGGSASKDVSPAQLEPAIPTVPRPSPDTRAAGIAELVDHLLATDACAERLAMYWLDLVRYADTVGYHGDQDHNISPYRDWVIDAFATNMPFDQFTREQLAGDLLPEAGVDQKIASGYNRLLQTSHEGGVQPQEYLAIYAADRVRNVSAVWMGATVGCAQCHDHKYDPYTAKDFYSLAAFFADVDEAQHFKVGSDSLPTNRPPEIKVHTRRERQQQKDLEHQLADVVKQLEEFPDDEDLAEQKKQLGFAIEDLHAAKRTTMITVSIEPREMRVLPRGDWLDDSGAVVQAAVPEFLRTSPHTFDAETEQSQGLTRLDLANWLTDPENGTGLLTARVFANRFWYLMLGSGLSPSLDDFGGQGFPPEHPELLDQLALEFVDSGWNVKHILKLIANSRAYQQSSAWTDQLRKRDPMNKLFARQSSFRLPAEMIRDSALEVSGLLVKQVGGSSVRPYQPAGYYRHLNFPIRKYSHHADERQWRRGLYVHWQRQFLHPMLKAFDAPTREECTAQRPESNTPLAALTLLNDPTFVEAAKAFAGRVLTECGSGSDEDRIRFAMQLAVSRDPDEMELGVFRELLANAQSEYRRNPAAAEQAVSTGMTQPRDNIDPVELASWMAVTRAILNLDEAITRN